MSYDKQTFVYITILSNNTLRTFIAQDKEKIKTTFDMFILISVSLYYSWHIIVQNRFKFKGGHKTTNLHEKLARNRKCCEYIIKKTTLIVLYTEYVIINKPPVIYSLYVLFKFP